MSGDTVTVTLRAAGSADHGARHARRGWNVRRVGSDDDRWTNREALQRARRARLLARRSPAPYDGALHDAYSFATASTVGFVVAGVSAVVLLVGIVIDVSHRKSHVSATARSLVVSF